MKSFYTILTISILFWVAIIFFGYQFWTHNKNNIAATTKKISQNVAKDIENSGTEGKKYGLNSTHKECLDRSIELAVGCNGLLCLQKSKKFLNSCLTSSAGRETLNQDSFCKEMPSPFNIIKLTSMGIKKCKYSGEAQEICAKLIVEAADRCEKIYPQKN